MSKPSAPPPPDYTGAAAAQGAANVDAARATAKLSNPNVVTPYGSQTVSYGANGDQDQATVTQSYSPEMQAINDKNLAVQGALADTAQKGIGNVQNVLGSGFDLSGLPTAPGFDTSKLAAAPINAGTTAQQAIMGRLQPQLERQRSQLETQMANQGIMAGSEAYKNAFTDQNQRENDLYSQATLQGIGLDQQARQQGLNEQGVLNQAGQQARQQGFQEQSYLRNLPLNEVTALLGASQVNSPTFQGYQGAQAAASPVFGATQAAGDYAGDVYNAKAGMYGNMMSGLMNIGGAGTAGLMQLSDRRLKREIVSIGKLPSGIPVYKYKYKWDDIERTGVMADEVKRVIPEAVFRRKDGYDMVDYGKLR